MLWKRLLLLKTVLAAAEEEVNATRDLKDTGDRNYRDAVTRYKKMETERNNFQRMMDKAAEETRLAKMEAQKEREEARHVRRRLTFYMRNQHKQDGSATSGGIPFHTLESLALSPTILSLTAGRKSAMHLIGIIQCLPYQTWKASLVMNHLKSY